MSSQDQQEPISKKLVVLTMPGMESIAVRSLQFPGGDGLPLTMDVYRPASSGPHAFDLVDNSEASQHFVQQVLDFLSFHLRPVRPPAHD